MPFQTKVNLVQAPAVEGDFASANPRASTLAGEAGLVAGINGVTIGRFAWVEEDERTADNFAPSSTIPSGFVHRDQQGVIPNYLEEESMIVPHGFAVTLHNEGDFFAMNYGPDTSMLGNAVYADFATGKPLFPAGVPPAVATGTASVGATFSAGGASNNLVVTAVTGYISVGDTLGTVTGVPAGTTITGQVSGTPGGAGTYTTSQATTVDGTVTSFGDVLHVVTVTTGNLQVGDAITGTGFPAGANISENLGGNGGVGNYRITIPTTAYLATAAFSVAGSIATNFVVRSIGAVGELVKISTWGKQ